MYHFAKVLPLYHISLSTSDRISNNIWHDQHLFNSIKFYCIVNCLIGLYLIFSHRILSCVPCTPFRKNSNINSEWYCKNDVTRLFFSKICFFPLLIFKKLKKTLETKNTRKNSHACVSWPHDTIDSPFVFQSTKKNLLIIFQKRNCKWWQSKSRWI